MIDGTANGTGARRDKKSFELIGGSPALDLVNTLDWRFRNGPPPEELLQDYYDLVQFSVQCSLLSDAVGRRLVRNVNESKAAQVVAAVRELREAAAEVLYAALEGVGPSASSMKVLEKCFREAREYERLLWDGEKLAWELSQSPAPAELPLWMLSLKFEDLMTSDEMHKLRECGNAECRWLFLDTSKNHTRRWCDMKICGNRMKARRFKAQRRG
ncbi:CGNR zinc finger domain-containing protein [Telmatobacter sp. DSM 110680]|uniref:CGNR zinc finger domain-containing protein n=1 Tax=Telmatobacter sp. DSM 110680 TaxID=3036704 RepID=A0AAU7DH28_9BACT